VTRKQDSSGESAELRQLREALEQSTRMRDKLLSIIAHDLRAPIAQLNALVFLLRETPKNITRDKMQVYADELEAATRHLSGTLENLLHWSSAQRRNLEPEWRRCDLGEVLEGAVGVYRAIAADKNVRLALEHCGGIALTTDPDMLALVVRNLVANAVKFTPAGGSVDVRCTEAADGAVCIEIVDTGVGMSADTLARARREHELVSTCGTRGERGTGLGLKLCYEFCAKIGADLRLESREGDGTRARITLPQRD